MITKKNSTKKVSKKIRVASGKSKIGKIVKEKVDSFLLKAQAFLESKKHNETSLRCKSVFAVAFFMKNKAVVEKEYLAENVLKGNTSSLAFVGKGTARAITLFTKCKVKFLKRKLGNNGLCSSFKLVK